MGKGLTAAQRRAVVGSDAATGRLAARPEVCGALAAAGLAVPHGRGGHHGYYLTSEGLRVRAALAESASGDSAQGAEVTGVGGPAVGGGFMADDGTGTVPPSGGGAGRAAEVAAAWEGLLQIRALLLDGSTDLPAPWERDRCVHAVALALEAAGCPPARPDSPGYTVSESPHPATAEITWSPSPAAAEALARIARLLDRHGWQSTHHRTRQGRDFLLTSPARR